MKNTKWFGLLLAAGLIAGGSFVRTTHAAERPALQGRAQMRGHLLEHAKAKLGLTQEQSARIKDVLSEEKETLTGLLSRLRGARAELRGAIQAADASETSVRAAAARVAAVEADLAVERLKLHGKLSPILSLEQREKLNEFQARMDDLMDSAIGRFGERIAE